MSSRTDSIHTWNSLPEMDFLARKWATELPSHFTWVKLQQRKPIARLRESLITKPNSGWFEPPAHNALETSLASPSKVASKTLSSNANRTARLHARASTVATEEGREILSVRAPITPPMESWIITPRPAAPDYLKIASS